MSTSFSDYIFNFSTLSTQQPFLLVAAIPPAGSVAQTILIRKIKIEELPPLPTFTLTPTLIPILCGITSSQTSFTISNVNNTPNVTNHTWNLGSSNNGWLYNGTPAPQTISTGTSNTLSLTPVCGVTPSNVYAMVTAGGSSFQTNIATISMTNPDLSINGVDNFCSGTSNYSINNLPCNTSISWAASPSGIVSLSCTTCPSTTVTKITDGVVTLTATITKNNPCSSGPEYKSLTVTVGTPKIIFAGSGQEAFNLSGQFFNYGLNGPGNSFSVCVNENLIFTPYVPIGYTPPAITAHEWTISGNYASIGILTQPYLSVTSASSHPNAFSFTYRYQNACGWSPVYNGSAGTMNCDIGEEPFRGSPTKNSKEAILQNENTASIFPNPVHHVLYVKLNHKNLESATIKIYNSLGKEVKRMKATAPLTGVNMSGLVSGIYLVQIFDGQTQTTYKIMKN